ncbi:MAG TPA: hypothetical protein EYP98_07740, partial [Planctomycetes bacterium]|nr:hypothetical protein [Planctomycetota bacterium]
MGEAEIIDPIVRTMVTWTKASSDPGGQLEANVLEITLLLRDLVRCQAFALTAWDPTANSYRHKTLASDGYSEKTLAHVNDAFVKANRAFALAHRNDPRSLRWRDYREDWDFDFSDTETAQEHLMPYGFKEGSTMCLRLPDGRYTGAIHMSWTSVAAATNERREITERFRPILATICDQLRTPQLLVETLAPDAFALVIAPTGMTFELPNRKPGTYLGDGGSLRQIILSKIGSGLPPRFVWPDENGACHRVMITPCHGDVSLITEEVTAWPFGLSLREIQV